MQQPDTWKPSRQIRRKIPAVIALMQAGMSDLRRIAEAVGMSVSDVERIGQSQPAAAKKSTTEVSPPDSLLRLRKTVFCPQCGSRIFLVPCRPPFRSTVSGGRHQSQPETGGVVP